MFLIERSVLPPRSNPGSNSRIGENLLSDGAAARTPPVPATFLESAAGGAFELFPRRRFAGAGNLIQAALPDPLMADPLMATFPAGQARAEPQFRAATPLPPLPIPVAPRQRRRA